MVANRKLPPTAQESTIARNSMRLLSRYAQEEKPLTLKVVDGDNSQAIELPAGAVALLMDILGAMATGRGVTLIPENAELTTVEAAEILNVSRPFLIKLLEDGKIPYRKIGKHRRVRIEDLMEYKQNIDEAREKILDQLVAEAQELGLGYE